MKKLAATALIVALLAALAAPALADLRRGDTGAGVRELQQLLVDCGWLNDRRSAGFTPDGVATDAVLERLRYDRAVLFGEIQPEASGEEDEFPERCRTMASGSTVRTQYCIEHMEVQREALELTAQGGEGFRAARELWEAAVEDLYADWMAGANGQDKLDVLAAYGAWRAAAQQQREALELLWPDAPESVESQLAAFFREQAATLCGMRSSGCFPYMTGSRARRRSVR